jgi:hypothetical protein
VKRGGKNGLKLLFLFWISRAQDREIARKVPYSTSRVQPLGFESEIRSGTLLMGTDLITANIVSKFE